MPDLFSELKRIKAELKGTESRATQAPQTSMKQTHGLAGMTPLKSTSGQAPRSPVSAAALPSMASPAVGTVRHAPPPAPQRQVTSRTDHRTVVGHGQKANIGSTKPSVKPPARQPVEVQQPIARHETKAVTPSPAPAKVVAVNRPEPVSQLFRPLPKGPLTRQALFRAPEVWVSTGGRTQMLADGHVGAIDIVIGLDFGTSYTKAAVGFRDKIFPVTWDAVSLCEPSYLLPSEYTELDDGSLFIGQHPAARQEEIRADLKLPFINPAVSSASIGRASSFVALVLRYVRAWVFHHHGAKLGRARLRWQLNIGVPSDGLENSRLVKAYQQLAATAWQRSLEGNPQQLANVGTALLSESAVLQDLLDLQVRPEFVAQMAGYMQSPQRQRGLHALVDVGGGTLDVVTFIVHKVDEDDTFPFLVPQVHALGTHGLIQNRLVAAEATSPDHAVDELAPITEPKDFAQATGLEEAHVAGRDELFKAELQRVIKSVFDTTKSRRYRLSDAWRTGVRTFFTGGGSRCELYRNAVETVTVPSQNGLQLTLLPPHKNLDGFTGGLDDYQRISVACGLAQDAFTLGRIVPAREVEDDRALVPSTSATRPDRDDLYAK